MPRAPGRGLLITLEGGEGSGKSTLARALAEQLHERGCSVLLTREPGGTSRGGMIQAIFEVNEGASLTPLAELLLFEADRAQHVSEEIVPALAENEIVVCDRFTDSSLAYQGFGRGLDLDFIRMLNEATTGGLKPDLTLLLDIPPEAGLARANVQRDATGREHLDFHARVRDGFLQLAKDEPDRFVVFDATSPLEAVTQAALNAIEPLLRRDP